ncbi:MAG: hypothetical protein GYA23_01495 [Methanomicrobiales archaeon]|nr:hypothetical protein [Methanomicrobiales archaeon]
METFTPPRPFVAHPDYGNDRGRYRQGLFREIGSRAIDPPLLALLQECMKVPHGFTLQCCYGHFVHAAEPDKENLVPVSRYTRETGPIEYRIAYLALCLEDSPEGHRLYSDLEDVAGLDPAFIQFGSADWFWEQIPNTYCLQIEPERMKEEDRGIVSWEEAIRIEELRGPFFERLMAIMHRHHVPE